MSQKTPSYQLNERCPETEWKWVRVPFNSQSWPPALYDHKMVASKTHIYIFGGKNQYGVENKSVWQFATKTGIWTQLSLTSSSQIPSSQPLNAFFLIDTIYIIYPKEEKQIYTFSIENNHFQPFASVKLNILNVCQNDHVLWMLGYPNDSSNPPASYNHVYSFDLGTQTFSDFTLESPAPPLVLQNPILRSSAGFTVLSKKYLVLHGGHVRHMARPEPSDRKAYIKQLKHDSRSDTWIFDIVQKQWSLKASNTQFSISDSCLIATHDPQSVVVMGGWAIDLKLIIRQSSSFQCYHYAKDINKWRKMVFGLSPSQMPAPRADFGVCGPIQHRFYYIYGGSRMEGSPNKTLDASTYAVRKHDNALIYRDLWCIWTRDPRTMPKATINKRIIVNDKNAPQPPKS